MYDNFFGYSRKSLKLIFSKPILLVPTIIQIVINIFLAFFIVNDFSVVWFLSKKI